MAARAPPARQATRVQAARISKVLLYRAPLCGRALCYWLRLQFGLVALMLGT